MSGDCRPKPKADDLRLTPAMARRIELWPLERLRPYEHNARTHSDEQVDRVAASIARFGFLNPILVDGRDGIAAGHCRLSAAKRLGLSEVPVVVLDHLSEDDRRAYVLADNRLAELSGWDDDVLAAQLRELDAEGFGDLTVLGWNDEELAAALELEDEGRELVQFQAGAGGNGEDEEEAWEIPERAVSQLGDVWTLGRHRLLCGDSHADGAVEGLLDGESVACVLTDPPYAIYGSASGVSSDVADAKLVRPFFEGTLRLAASVVKPFGHVYVFCDWRSWGSWTEVAPRTGLQLCNMLVWDKGSGIGSMFANCHELVGFYTRTPKQKTLTGRAPTGQRQVLSPNILRYPRPGGSAGFEGEHEGGERLHAAAKPVLLLAKLLELSTDAGEVVLEPFAGSGSTLIAAETMGRRCFAVEMEPRMVDVIVQRWEGVSGAKAKLGRKLFETVRRERLGP